MSDAQAPQNRYKADLREIRFLLFEQFKLAELLGQAPYEDVGARTRSRMVARRDVQVRAARSLGPLNAVGDRVGCRIEDGAVEDAARLQGRVGEASTRPGWKSVSVAAELGGQGAPRHALQVLVEEMLSRRQRRRSYMYPGLALRRGRGHRALRHAGAAQAVPAQPMFAGKWGGTMCLTEPQAGSDVGSARTTREAARTASYRIRGTKIFISGGDHDLRGEHRAPRARARRRRAAGHQGPPRSSSCPKIARRTTTARSAGPTTSPSARIEHKMGINGSATCVLNFGESDACVGELGRRRASTRACRRCSR